MSFAEEAAVARGQRYADGAAIFKPQREWPPNESYISDLVVRGSFKPVQARDRHAGADQDALIPGDGVAHVTQDGSVTKELSGARRRFDQLEGRVLHPPILPVGGAKRFGPYLCQ
jgi:hypothetical protein